MGEDSEGQEERIKQRIRTNSNNKAKKKKTHNTKDAKKKAKKTRLTIRGRNVYQEEADIIIKTRNEKTE